MRHALKQLAGHMGEVRQLLDLRMYVLDQLPGAHALAHPALEIGLTGAPEVEIRVQLAAEAFDIEQGFLQQNQLRLYFHIEASCHLEQTD